MDFYEGGDEEYDEGMDEMGEEGYDDEGEGMEEDDGAGAGGMPGGNQAAMLQQFMRAQQGQQKQDKLKELIQYGIVTNELGDLCNFKKTDLILAGVGLLLCFKETPLQPIILGAAVLRWQVKIAGKGSAKTSGSAVLAEELLADESWRPEVSEGWQVYQRVNAAYEKLIAASAMAHATGQPMQVDDATLQEVAQLRRHPLSGSVYHYAKEMDNQELQKAAFELPGLAAKCQKLALVAEPFTRPQRGPLHQLGWLLGQVQKGFSRLVNGEPQWHGDSEWLQLPRAADEDPWVDLKKARARKAAKAASQPPALAPGGGMPGMGAGMGLPGMFQNMFGGMRRG